MKNKMIDTTPQPKKAVLVAIALKNQAAIVTKNYLEELSFLAFTLGIVTKKWFTQQLEKPYANTYLGKGKLEEIQSYIITHAIDCIIFDDELSPSQVRNIEKVCQCKIMDRSLLILEIFAMRAKTAQAKTQVALAQYQYLLPRLTRLWTHLSKQKGGIGMRGGPGEKELETDKRIVKDKIALLKNRLKAIQKQNRTQEKQRNRLVRVALVGYTNVGKSTLMKALSKKESYVEDKLFATVDATVRKIIIDRIPLLLTDTVGFIRKLPHTLIESFQSTLEEVKNADLLLHVIDSTHPAFEEQIQTVKNTLQSIHAEHIPIILVFNKIDNWQHVHEKKSSYIEKIKKAKNKDPYILISAEKKKNIDNLQTMIYTHIKPKHLAIYPNFLEMFDVSS